MEMLTVTFGGDFVVSAAAWCHTETVKSNGVGKRYLTASARDAQTDTWAQQFISSFRKLPSKQQQRRYARNVIAAGRIRQTTFLHVWRNGNSHSHCRGMP
mmetsp:Transcript_19478/g.54134  ORF Transcript_19478/g.54134 Transcript_19478/m.54134 type:complete len:100 (-) Transcript_19478:42-341(-)